MVVCIDFEPPDLVVATVSEVLSSRDQLSVVNWVRGVVRAVPSVRLLIRLERFAGWNPDASLDGDEAWLQDDEGVSKIAIVGEMKWKLALLTAMAQPLRRIPIEYFEAEAAARRWLEPTATTEGVSTRTGESV